MANPYVLNFAPVTNALAGWQKQRNTDREFEESGRRWEAQNALAQGQFGLQQRAAAREDERAPLKMELLKSQIEAARRSGATEAQLTPLKIEMMRAQTELYGAQAHAARQKDELNSTISGMLRGAMPGAQPPATAGDPNFRPQSFNGQPPTNYLAPTPVGNASDPSADPMLVQTQGGPGAAPPMPQADPDVVNTPMGPMPIERARQMGFALGLAGKGDAGKIFIDAANADRMDKTARGEVEKDLVGLTGTIGRLESIGKRFDPKFLEIPQRAGMAWAALKDRFGSLPEDQKADLGRYTKFRQTSVQNAALYVKYLSGVAVSEAEFKRIMTTLPNAGTGIADGDSPTEFKSKMDESITQAKMAYARAMYLRSHGFRGKPWEAGVALDDMGDIIRQRGAEIQQQLQGRVAPERMQTTVRQKLKQEFGI